MMVVVADVMRNRADDREVVGSRRKLREMFAHSQAGRTSRDVAVDAAHFGWRVRFWVEGVVLRRAAPGHDEDDGLLGFRPRASFRVQQLRQRQADRSQAASNKSLAACESEIVWAESHCQSPTKSKFVSSL
jgi:hypothetical protein